MSEIIPPAPPCFRRRLRPRRGECVQAKRVAEATSGRDRLRGLGVLGGLCSDCGISAGVSSRTHLRWPTPVRPAPDSCVKGRDFQMLGENGATAGAGMIFRADFAGDSRMFRHGGSNSPSVLSTLWGVRVTSEHRRGKEVSGGRGLAGGGMSGDAAGECSPVNKSFRKEDGGAGEGGKPFFKRVSSFPRISLPLFLPNLLFLKTG